MSDNIMDKYGDNRHLSEETREDLRRMTLGLTDQKTIETLTRAGLMAKNKRESSRALRAQAIARAEAEKVAAAKEKAADDQKKATIIEETIQDGDVNDGGTQSDKTKKK
ncbi:hypothetical protein FLONG3_7261 [Fusarium longipes]|uniref:Uncharacterized protein n=1 Tax=Fusarium longipes TaxID=694270 RepID=A0A395SFD0_9HYPO|nr:hypothetical protein FLONG3_7261 [Fusarium longipes]